MSEPSGEHALDVALAQAGPVPLDVRFTCGKGELLALTGPSGSGKTTVLRAIAGLLRPAAGHVRIDGQTWFDAEAKSFTAPQQRRVGLVFQDYALFPHLTALDNVGLAVPNAARLEKQAKARALLERVHLDGLEQRRPAELSGGQRQRVALARALAREPRVLLLDEPFSAVDQMTRERLKRELAQLRESLAIPIVLVTHDMSEALALADRISVLYRGKTLETGAPEDVRLRPSSPLVARLMGETNLFEGVLDAAATPECAGRLTWRDSVLDVRSTGAFRAGDRVAWLIPADFVVLHRRGRPAAGDGENPVQGVISEVVSLGDRFSVTIETGGGKAERLNFKVASHTLRRHDLAPGTEVSVSLLTEGVHVMGVEA